MTTALLLRVAVKRWYLTLIGLALTAAAVAMLYQSPTTIYWSESTVTILQPRPNPLATEGFQLADLSSVLVLRTNGRPAVSKTSSPETTLYGEGITEGTRIRVRDVGRQWATSIPDPVVLVEAVGPSPEWVTSHMQSQLDTLQQQLDELQTSLGIAESKLVFLRVSPESPEVLPVTGSRARAAGSAALLGCTATGVLLYLSNRRWPITSRRERVSRAPATPAIHEETRAELCPHS